MPRSSSQRLQYSASTSFCTSRPTCLCYNIRALSWRPSSSGAAGVDGPAGTRYALFCCCIACTDMDMSKEDHNKQTCVTAATQCSAGNIRMRPSAASLSMLLHFATRNVDQQGGLCSVFEGLSQDVDVCAAIHAVPNTCIWSTIMVKQDDKCRCSNSKPRPVAYGRPLEVAVALPFALDMRPGCCHSHLGAQRCQP